MCLAPLTLNDQKALYGVPPMFPPISNKLAAFSFAWPDQTLDRLIAVGATPLGQQPTRGIFRLKTVRASRTLPDLIANNSQIINNILKASPPPLEQRWVIWEKSCNAQDSGWLSGWRSAAEMDAQFGIGLWCPLRRFAILAGSQVAHYR